MDRYLLDTEDLVFAVRRHPAVLAGATSIYLVVLAVAFLLLGFADGSGAIATTGLTVLLVGSAWFGWKVGDWHVERFTVTDRRVLLVSGLLTRRVAIMPLRKVTDLTFERSFAGRVFGYGAFVMESAGQQQALSRVDYLPRPESLYLQMSDLLFGRGRADHDPDEDGAEGLPDPRGPRSRRPAGRRTATRPAATAAPRRVAPRVTSRPPLVPPPPTGRVPDLAPRPSTGTGTGTGAGAGAGPAPGQDTATRRVPPSAPPSVPPSAPPPGSTTPLPRIAGDRPVARRPRGRHDPGPDPTP